MNEAIICTMWSLASSFRLFLFIRFVNILEKRIKRIRLPFPFNKWQNNTEIIQLE